jgi:hypothetical protein
MRLADASSHRRARIMDHFVVRLWRIAQGHRGGWLRTPARLALLLGVGLLQRPRLQAWLATVETHRRLVAAGPSLLRMPPGGERVLWQSLPGGPRLQLVLARPVRIASEGELALHLVEGETRIASLGFTLGCRGSLKVVYAGTLQHTPHAPALHGMPAEEFLRAAFRSLCDQLGAARILGLTDGNEFDPGPFDLDIALDAAARERQRLLERVATDIARACGHAYTPTLPRVRLRDALPV